MRPSSVVLGSDNTLINLEWTNWSYNQAIGTGLQAGSNCIPDCANGTVTYLPASVTAYDPQTTKTGLVFAKIAVTSNGKTSVYSMTGNYA